MDENMTEPTKDMSNSAPAPTPPSVPSEPMKSADGYGKKGGWGKWILIYVVIAVVVYGVIYYFIKHNGGSTGTGY